jgi:hypothetical protein
VVEQNASVYSVQPYFLDGVISFYVQLSGAPGGFNLNASTTIAAGSIGTDPEPNLVLVPKSMRTRVPKSAEETAMIIAVTFNTDESIAYYVQLSNGKVVKLYGDKFVHDIDLIEPNAPPALSILTSHSLPHLKRDATNLPTQAAPMTIVDRGMEGMSSDTATFQEETCRSIRCLSNGGQPAMFNPFLKTCHCKKLTPPEHNLNDKLKRSQPTTSNEPARREAGRPPLPSEFRMPSATPRVPPPAPPPVFEIPKPSVETCGRMMKCHGESESYFEPNTKQCLCVVWRPGIKEPVITSDAKILPREEQAFGQQEDNNVEDNSNQDLRHEPPASYPGSDLSNLSPKYCATVWAKANCDEGIVGRMSYYGTACYCLRRNVNDLWPRDIDDTVENIPDSMDAPFLGKRDNCADGDHECSAELMAVQYGLDRKMATRHLDDHAAV